MAWPGRRWERLAPGDPRARRPAARAVRPAPPPAAGRPGAAAVRGGRAGPRPPAAADHAEPTVASSRVTETLIGVGFGVLGLVTVIFSLLFLVVQWAFSSLSPRLTLFRDDPIVWRTFGLAIGVFVFSVTAALVIGNDPEVSVIVPATEVAGVLAALALLRTLQVKAFASIQLAPTLSAIAARGRSILDDLYPQPGPGDASLPPAAAAAAPGRHLAAPAGHLAATQPAPAARCRRWRRGHRAPRPYRRHAPGRRRGRRPARRRYQ